MLIQLLIGPLDWTRKIEKPHRVGKKYIARNHAPMKTRLDHDSIIMLILASVQIVLRLGPDPDRGPPIEYPCVRLSQGPNRRPGCKKYLDLFPSTENTQKFQADKNTEQSSKGKKHRRSKTGRLLGKMQDSGI